MKLEDFNAKLQRNVDPRTFCTLDFDPQQVRHVRYAGRRREPEKRYVIWQKLGDGTTKMLMVIRGDQGEFREPCEQDLQHLREMMELFVGLWSKVTKEGRDLEIRKIEASLDRAWLETREAKFRAAREFIRRESAPRLMHLYGQFAGSHFVGKRQF